MRRGRGIMHANAPRLQPTSSSLVVPAPDARRAPQAERTAEPLSAAATLATPHKKTPKKKHPHVHHVHERRPPAPTAKERCRMRRDQALHAYRGVSANMKL
eukprot:scaffold6568_cov126-Isochrysis_galbana.AAC.11